MRRPEFYIYLLSGSTLLYVVAARHWHLRMLSLLCRTEVEFKLLRALHSLGLGYHLGFLALPALVLPLMAMGVRPYLTWRKYQRAIDCLALTSGIGLRPTLVRVSADGEHRTKLVVKSEGLGIDRYESKRGDLEAALGAVIESIKPSGSPRFVEIRLTQSRIPEKCEYKGLLSRITRPNSFLVGESLGGLLIQCIRDLPHLLIAGASGEGKSIFFKQVLLCLAKTSSHMQMYLLDLKGGVEMKEFAQLPNVVVAKDEFSAVQVLSHIKAEMDRRFTYMEKHGYKRIEPERDKMDLIVVGVDEASVLYTKPSGKSAISANVQKARELTDNLAKLARAAGIHLILATQKVTKETIDTKIQENIGGRMCFRMNTLQGSLTVLGNKMAFELPHHPGRAIWTSGNRFVEVQAPFISESEIENECQVLCHEFESQKRKNFQSLLVTNLSTPLDERPIAGTEGIAA